MWLRSDLNSAETRGGSQFSHNPLQSIACCQFFKGLLQLYTLKCVYVCQEYHCICEKSSIKPFVSHCIEGTAGADEKPSLTSAN